LPNVVQVEHLHDKPAVIRDLALIKVAVNSRARPEVMQLCDIFRGRIVDVAKDSVIVELTGEEDKLESFTGLLGQIGIIEMVRTGIVAMGRGEHTVTPTNGYRRRAAARSHTSVL
jgi:acetolactate synthase-1/3 small subunit